MSHSTTVVQATDNRQIEVRFFLGQPNNVDVPRMVRGRIANPNYAGSSPVIYSS